MPSGGLAAIHHISATGGADSMLTEDPQVSNWAHESMRHTRFALDASSVSLTGSTKCGGNTKTQIPREGDLMTSLYVVIDLPGIDGSYKNRVGQMLVDKCSINIGNQCIDEVTSDYLFMWDCLSGQAGKALDEMIGSNYDDKNPKGKLSDKFAKRLYVPIPVWFNSAIPGGVTGNALQLISLQFHAVSVNLNVKSILECCSAGAKVLSKQRISTIGKVKDADITTTDDAGLSNDDTNVGLEVGFVYLDSAERQQFADLNMEILVRQLQVMTKKTSKNSSESHRLYFNHPVSELLFAARKDPKEPFDLSGKEIQDDDGNKAKMDPITSVQLKFNNHTRLNNVGNGSAVPAEYFRTVQPFQHHSRIPDAADGEFVYSYSFAIHPEEVQPSGSCNFSRIDNCVLDLQYDNDDKEYETIVLATNWNILRISNGMAGIAYSN